MAKISASKLTLCELLCLHLNVKLRMSREKDLVEANFYGNNFEKRVSCFG